MDDWWVKTVKILASRDNFSQVLGTHAFTKSPFLLQQGVDLPLRCVFQYQIEALVVFVVVIEFHYVGMVQLVHNFNLELDLLY